MKITSFETEESWKLARRGRITGTRLKDLVITRTGSKPKIGYYELIAERIAVPAVEGESAMDRGKRLEEIALQEFAEKTGKKVKNDLVIWSRDDDERIAVSPDGTIGKTEAVEVKCLASARHLEAYMTGDIPDEYEFQVLQYFIVNEQLKRLHFCFYDPRMPGKSRIFWFTVERKSVAADVEEYLELERKVLADVERIETDLTF